MHRERQLRLTKKRHVDIKENVLPWLVWLSRLSAGLRTKRSPVLFPVRAHAWVAGQVSPVGSAQEATTYGCFSLYLSPSLPFSLKINK